MSRDNIKLRIRICFFNDIVKHWNKLPKEVATSPSLEVFGKPSKCVPWGHGSVVSLAVLG